MKEARGPAPRRVTLVNVPNNSPKRSPWQTRILGFCLEMECLTKLSESNVFAKPHHTVANPLRGGEVQLQPFSDWGANVGKIWLLKWHPKWHLGILKNEHLRNPVEHVEHPFVTQREQSPVSSPIGRLWGCLWAKRPRDATRSSNQFAVK